jgi:ABC-type microcin C transport system permease subunit YejE
VLARLIYGFRISVLFGLIADHHLVGHRRRGRRVQGYFGGWTDLCSSASSRSGPRSRRSICC